MKNRFEYLGHPINHQFNRRHKMRLFTNLKLKLKRNPKAALIIACVLVAVVSASIIVGVKALNHHSELVPGAHGVLIKYSVFSPNLADLQQYMRYIADNRDSEADQMVRDFKVMGVIGKAMPVTVIRQAGFWAVVRVDLEDYFPAAHAEYFWTIASEVQCN